MINDLSCLVVGRPIIFNSIFPCARKGSMAKIIEIKTNHSFDFPEGIVVGIEFESDGRITYAGINELDMIHSPGPCIQMELKFVPK